MERNTERKKASDFPQELLNLLNGYVHGGISRRQFLDRAQKFAVGGVTAMALFEMLRPNYAWAIQIQPDDKRIKTSTETLQSPEGYGTVKGYLARPANDTKQPAVIVIHENRGLNPYIQDVGVEATIIVDDDDRRLFRVVGRPREVALDRAIALRRLQGLGRC